MRNGSKLATLAAVVSALMGGAAMADGFPTWDQVGKGLSTGDTSLKICNPVGGVNPCTETAKGNGFLQFQVKGSDGLTYIITNIDDNRGFSDQSMVRMTPNNQTGVEGIRTLQNIESPKSGTVQGPVAVFNSTTAINAGWGQDVAGAALGGTVVNISQGINDPGKNNDAFKTGFNYQSQSSSSGQFLGADIEITQSNQLQNDTSNSAFLLRDRSGIAYVPTAGSVTVPAGGTTPGTITWAAGERVKGVWLGQDIVTPATTTTTGISTYMGFVGFEVRDADGNVKTGGTINDVAVDDKTKSQSAWIWGDVTGPLGSKPCMSDPSGASCPQ